MGKSLRRYCINASQGRGMLIGSNQIFCFWYTMNQLVHHLHHQDHLESMQEQYIIAVSPDGTTNYLSEDETGSEVLILNSKGKQERQL